MFLLIIKESYEEAGVNWEFCQTVLWLNVFNNEMEQDWNV